MSEQTSKHDHPRVGPETEVANPDEEMIYAEYYESPFSLTYHPDTDLSSAFDDQPTYKVTVNIYGEGEPRDVVYQHVEEVGEQTAHAILDARNDGYWEYVE